MIRLLWVGVTVAAATALYGTIVVAASLLRVRGEVYYWATQQWSRSILWASAVPVVAHGMERVDWSEPQILVSNHLSWYDIFAVAAVLPGRFHFVGKKELDRIPLFGTAWRAAGHISIDRSNRQQSMIGLRRAGERIRREKSTVVIYPEGTRSRTGDLQPFKKGAFMLAMEAQVPVVPLVVHGSFEIMRPGDRRIRPRPVHLYFGEPLSPQQFASGSVDALVGEVHGRMRTLQAQARARAG